MAEGSHLFPSRTQKLSLLAPMVLHWRRCGRVGHCQVFIQSPIFKLKVGFFLTKIPQSGRDSEDLVTAFGLEDFGMPFMGTLPGFCFEPQLAITEVLLCSRPHAKVSRQAPNTSFGERLGRPRLRPGGSVAHLQA